MPLGKSEQPGAPDDGPRRLDASALKAYAHPLRLRMIQYLNDHGSATATELAKALDESTGQTSYHLRQLARHGLVEDDPERGTGRERWWRSTSFRIEASTMLDEPALAEAARAMLDAVVRGRAETLAAWIARADSVPQEWLQASMQSQSTLHLTPNESAELGAAILEVLDRFTARSRAHEREGTPAARRVRAYVDVFPLPEDEPGT